MDNYNYLYHMHVRMVAYIMVLLTILRVIVVVLMLVSIGYTLAVFRLYSVALKKAPAGTPTLLSWHVAVISLSTLLWGSALTWAVLDQLTNPFSSVATDVYIRTTMYGLGAIGYISALHIVGGLQVRKIRFCKTDTGLEVDATDEPESK
jgi:hypothetical protein